MIKFNSGETVQTTKVIASTEEMAGFRRSVATITTSGIDYAKAAELFVDGAVWSIIDDKGIKYDSWNTYTKAGAITDNRDGTLIVKMGKANAKEQDLEEEKNKVVKIVEDIAGAPVSSFESTEVIRKVVEAGAATLSDEEAIKMPSLSKKWVVGESVEVDERRYYDKTGLLYKCRTKHTTQQDWEPDKTPAMWVVINNIHSGLKNDPIPAARGMEYIYGKYYGDPEDGQVYLCQRTGEEEGGTVVLQYLPHELVGQYFELDAKA